MAILPNHLADLRGSGLSDETITAAKIHSEEDHHKLAAMLNRRSWPRTYGAALVFPFYDDAGTVVTHRVKPSHPPSRNGKAAKYISPTGATVRAYIPPSQNGDIADPDRALIVAEGEKKCLAATQAGFVAVGLTGVDCWHTKKSSALIPDLERVAWKGRRVFIVFDSDAATNENVKTNESLLAAALKNRGAVVKIVRLPPGENGAKTGLDDFLIARGVDELHKLLNAAEDPEPPAPEDVKMPASTLDAAEESHAFLQKFQADGQPLLRYWRGLFLHWTKGAYREKNIEQVRSELVRFLNPRYFRLTTSAITNTIEQLRAQSELRWETDAPAWLGEPPVPDWQPHDLLVARNGIFHLPAIIEGRTPHTIPATPKLFCTSAADFDVQLDAPKPERWLQFLSELWPDDPESIGCLQEWFGYLITTDTSQQKVLCLISPKRGGKGTISRVIRGLIGTENVAGPTLASLASPFGLWSLINRSVAIVPDARLSGRSDRATVVERLLSISGEDFLTIERKCLTSVHAKLPTRIIVLSNEIPRLADASGTIASRMICLRMTKSFYGVEDLVLIETLLAELPGILLWAIGGWKRLRERGHFQQPASGAGIVEEMEGLASPVTVFLRDRCNVGAEFEVDRQELFDAYLEWAKDEGKKITPDAATFGRDLRAVLPDLADRRIRADDGRQRQHVGVGLKAGF